MMLKRNKATSWGMSDAGFCMLVTPEWIVAGWPDPEVTPPGPAGLAPSSVGAEISATWPDCAGQGSRPESAARAAAPLRCLAAGPIADRCQARPRTRLLSAPAPPNLTGYRLMISDRNSCTPRTRRPTQRSAPGSLIASVRSVFAAHSRLRCLLGHPHDPLDLLQLPAQVRSKGSRVAC